MAKIEEKLEEKPKELSEEEKAKQLLQELEIKKQQDFLSKYEALCIETGWQLHAGVQFSVVPFQKK